MKALWPCSPTPPLTGWASWAPRFGSSATHALAPVSSERALQLISQTRLARIASGYRGLLAATSLDGLAECVANFSALAGDLRNELGAGELNPVLIREGSGHVCVVDSLLLTATQ